MCPPPGRTSLLTKPAAQQISVGAGPPISQFQELVDIEGARTIMMMSQSSSSLTTEEAGVRSIADACDTVPCPAPNMDACITPGPRTPARKASKVSLLCDKGSLGGCFTVGEGTASQLEKAELRKPAIFTSNGVS